MSSEDAAPVVHEPGIYFGLSDTDYHADQALGSSWMKAYAVDPFEAQFDRIYGEDVDTEAMTFGSAVHKRMLEGRAAFEACYCRAFDPGALDGALDTVQQIKDFLDQHGQTGLSKFKKDELIKLALDIDPTVKIVEVIRRKWEAEHAGLKPLSLKRWAQIETACRWVQRDPLLSAVMEDGAFIHGAPEVSIFYEDRGVRLKARLDRLLRHAIIDLKTYAPMFNTSLESAAIKTIERMRYDLQSADYIRAWKQAKALFGEGRVFGEEPFPGFLAECFDREEPAWIWIMIKSKGAPQPLVIDWQAKSAKAAATAAVETAIDRYIELRDQHGEHVEWPPMRPALTLRDTDLPSWFGRN